MRTSFLGQSSSLHLTARIALPVPRRPIRRLHQVSASATPFDSPAPLGSTTATSGISASPLPAPFTSAPPSLDQLHLHTTQAAPQVCAATGGGDGGSIGGSGGGSGGAGGDGDNEEEYLNLQQAEELAATKGIELPEDFAAAASSGGLRKSVFNTYTSIMSGGALTSFLARSLPAFRDRLIADKLYFFKILAEVTIDSACATVAEVRKRGEEFWSEFEFYLSDLLVGLVLDVVLVTLLAPVAIPGRAAKANNHTGIRKWADRLPSAMFEKSVARKYSVSDRVGCYFVRGLEYSLAGMACGAVGQGIASGMMRLKRHYGGHSDDDVAVPPVIMTALVWGLFMGVSSNTRYQIVFGLERVVDETVARNIPQVAYLTTLAIRFINNVIGGEQFIDMARWAKIQ